MIYSLDKINEMADGDQGFISSVIAVFLEEVPSDLEALETALDEGDHKMAYGLAHKIKPNVDLLGMEQSREIALEIETLGKDASNIDAMRKVFPALKIDIQQVMSELKKDFKI